MHFLAQRVQGYMAAPGYLSHLPVMKEEGAMVSPDPCSPITNSVSLPTLFSPELLDEKEEPLSDRQEFSSAIMCKPIEAHAFTFFRLRC